jgi:hypothetical protein
MKNETYDAYEKAGRMGAEILAEVLGSGQEDEPNLSRARIATSAMSSFAKLYQAQSAREATVVTIISRAAPTTEEFRRLVGSALPGSNVAKAIQEGPSIPQPSTAELSQGIATSSAAKQGIPEHSEA